MKKILLLTMSFLAFSTPHLSYSQETAPTAFKENLLFTATMNGAEAIPAVSTPAKGVGSFMLNKLRNEIAVNISFNNLSSAPTNVSIYYGAEGTNGSLFLDLTTFMGGNRVITTITGTNVTANLAKYFGDELYVVVKTANNPNGEIRGQIKLETDLNFVADLDGMETIPMITVSGAYGLGSFGLSMDQSNLDFKVICKGLTGAISSAKLYSGTTGMIGTEIADLSSFINGNVITGNITPSAAMLSDLLVGEVYLNITTAQNPTGELRSQLINYKGVTFDGRLDGSQMVPPVSTPAQGVAVFRFSPDFTTFYYDIVVDGLPTAVDYSHLHIGEFGQPYNSTSVQVDFTNSINGNRIQGTKTNISALNKDRLLTSKLALLIHSAQYPQGEIRSQVVRYAREAYTVNLEGAQVVPSVAGPAYGSGIVSISRDGDNAHYNWIAGNMAAAPTGSHFKNNVAGQNGSAIYDMTSAMSVVGNSASANGFWKSTDSTPFLPIHTTQFSSDSVYLDIQNSAYPNGEVRGQVLNDFVTYVLATDSHSANLNLVVYPNPSNGIITLSVPELENSNAKIEVFDLVGRSAFRQNLTVSSSEMQIDLSNLSKGNYILKISIGDEITSKKVTLN